MYEIERKFFIKDDKIPNKFDSVTKIRQGYLFNTELGVTRIRQHGDDYILTLKLRDDGIKQIEIEKPLTEEEFELLWTKINSKIVKNRYRVGRWEIDEFLNLTGKYKGLVLAEIELSAVDEKIDIPDWINQEVTGYSSYFNSNLIDHCEGGIYNESFK